MLEKLQRATGTATLGFKQRGTVTAIDDLYQQGSAKVRLARREPHRLYEAVLINTSGGLTDGDQYCANLSWGQGTCAIVTTQAAERIYKARSGTDYANATTHAAITTKITIAEGARAFWLPQETIMFDAAAYTRATLIDMAANATFLAIESSVFGRTAMGENINSGSLKETWQIRIDGKLVFADAFALNGDIAKSLDQPVIANGARAISSLIYIGPEMEKTRDTINQIIEAGTDQQTDGRAGIIDDILVTRLCAQTGQALRALTMPILDYLLNHATDTQQGASLLPRVWSL